MRIGFIGDTIISSSTTVGPRLTKVLQETDFNIANFEGPFIQPLDKPRKRAGMHQLTHDVTLLKQLNVKAVSLANNHMMDFGGTVLPFTIQHLKENGIACFGAGNDLNESNQYYEIELDKNKYRFYGAMQRYHSGHHFATASSPGIAQYRSDYFQQTVVKTDDVKNILFLHWNQEFEDYPEPVSKKSAELLMNQFDLIVGSHPHCVQGIYSKNGSHVVYSLGNFLLPHVEYFNTTLKSYPDKSYYSFVCVWNNDINIDSLEVIPCVVSRDGCHIEIADDDVRDEVLGKIQKYSEALNLSDKEYKQFYLASRHRKERPLLRESEFINRLKIGLYMSLRQLWLDIESGVAHLLDIMGLRKVIKKGLSVFFKRYH